MSDPNTSLRGKSASTFSRVPELYAKPQHMSPAPYRGPRYEIDIFFYSELVHVVVCDSTPRNQVRPTQLYKYRDETTARPRTKAGDSRTHGFKVYWMTWRAMADMAWCD